MRYYIANGLFLAIFSASVTNAEWLRFVSSDLKTKNIDDPTAGYYLIGWAHDAATADPHLDDNKFVRVVYGTPSTLGNRVNWSRLSTTPNEENGADGLHYWVTTDSIQYRRPVLGIATIDVDGEQVAEGAEVKQLVTKLWNPMQVGTLAPFYCPAPGSPNNYRLGDRGKINADITTELLAETVTNGFNGRKAVRIPSSGKSAVGTVVDPQEHRWEVNREGFRYLQWPNSAADQSVKSSYWLCRSSKGELRNIWSLYTSNTPLDTWSRKCKRGLIVRVQSENEDDPSTGAAQSINHGYSFGASGTEHSAPDFGSQYGSGDDLEGNLVDKIWSDPEVNPQTQAAWRLKEMERAADYRRSKSSRRGSRLKVFKNVNAAVGEGDDYPLDRPARSSAEGDVEEVPRFVQDENQQKLIDDLAQLMAAEKPNVPQEAKKKKLTLGSKIFPPINTNPQLPPSDNKSGKKIEKKKSDEVKVPTGIAAKNRPYFEWMASDDDYLQYNEEERERASKILPPGLGDLDDGSRSLPPGLGGSDVSDGEISPGLGGVRYEDNIPPVDINTQGEVPMFEWPGSEPRLPKQTRPNEESRAGPGVDYTDFKYKKVRPDQEETDELLRQRWRDALHDDSKKASLIDQVFNGKRPWQPPQKKKNTPVREEETKYDPDTGMSVPPKSTFKDYLEESPHNPIRRIIRQQQSSDDQITSEDDDGDDEEPEEIIKAPEEPPVVEVIKPEIEEQAPAPRPPIDRVQLVIDNEDVPEANFDSQEAKDTFLNKLRTEIPRFKSRVGSYSHFERSYLKQLKDRVNIYARALLNKSIQDHYDKNDPTKPYAVPRGVLQSDEVSRQIGNELDRLAPAEISVDSLRGDVADYVRQLPTTSLKQYENTAAVDSLNSQGEQLLNALSREKQNKKIKEQKDSVEESLKKLDQAVVQAEWVRSFAALRASFVAFTEQVHSGGIDTATTEAEAAKLKIAIVEAIEKAKALKLGSLKKDHETLEQWKAEVDKIILSADVVEEVSALTIEVENFAGDDDEQRKALAARVDDLTRKLSLIDVREGEQYRPSILKFKSILAPKPIEKQEQPSTDDVVPSTRSKKKKNKKNNKAQPEEPPKVEPEVPAVVVQKPPKKSSTDLEKDRQELDELRKQYVNTLLDEQRNAILREDRHGLNIPAIKRVKEQMVGGFEERKYTDVKPTSSMDTDMEAEDAIAVWNREQERKRNEIDSFVEGNRRFMTGESDEFPKPRPKQQQQQQYKDPNNPFNGQKLDKAIDHFISIAALLTKNLGEGPIAEAATHAITGLLNHELGDGTAQALEKAKILSKEIAFHIARLQNKIPSVAQSPDPDDPMAASLRSILDGAKRDMEIAKQKKEAELEQQIKERERAEAHQRGMDHIMEAYRDNPEFQAAQGRDHRVGMALWREMITTLPQTREWTDAAAWIASYLESQWDLNDEESIERAKAPARDLAGRLRDSQLPPMQAAQKIINMLKRMKAASAFANKQNKENDIQDMKKPDDGDSEKNTEITK